MSQKFILIGLVVIISLVMFVGCNSTTETTDTNNQDTLIVEKTEMEKKVEQYASFKLTTDLSVLTEKEKQILALFISHPSVLQLQIKEEAFVFLFQIILINQW